MLEWMDKENGNFQTHTQNVKSTAFNVKQSNQKNDAAEFSFCSIVVFVAAFLSIWYVYMCGQCSIYIFLFIFRITPSTTKNEEKTERFELSLARLPIHMSVCGYVEL